MLRECRDLLQQRAQVSVRRDAPQFPRKVNAELQHAVHRVNEKRRRRVALTPLAHAAHTPLKPAELVHLLQQRNDALGHGHERHLRRLLLADEAHKRRLKPLHVLLVAQLARSVARSLEHSDARPQLG